MIPDDVPAVPVRLWHASSSSSDAGPIEQFCEDCLDESERTRADRFRQPTSRNQHVIGRGMARRLLGVGDISPAAISFDTETFGKPFVTGPDVARRPFNVAHTDGLVVCGIADPSDWLVGVDVECLNRRTDPALADRYFSKPEIDYLKQYRNESDRRNAFLRVWTLKESFIKAIGTGLQTPLADFAFEDIDSPCPTIRMLDPKLHSDRQWQFFSITPRQGFIGAIAVASETGTAKPTIELHSFDDWVGAQSSKQS
ncbi:4'-phosphopantetheinyl transferase sfp [Rubripirellula lacrimiformis]|uniref:4'-phosphopantetheinyl transferase sfp n=1 Tax=Rubripirellula lacrimiformis TaxID=1930273 RepID=A0A517NKG6_9BACT|nr:4'-phosphopantetheinyl transferase superfamily protein [Rubripirellula lacrimiformis]QDT07637.1 4'-phosphopantetheinyl transferase sfp [Rubripirellula lacrimiformis]